MTATRTIVLAGILATIATPGKARGDAGPLVLVVKAGASARRDTPVRLELPTTRLGPVAPGGGDGGPKALVLREVRAAAGPGAPVVAQVESVPESSPPAVRLTFVVPGETPALTSRRFRVDPRAVPEGDRPWSLTGPSGGSLRLANRGRPVFRYNTAPVSHPDFPKVPARDAYIHPAFTSSGAVITGDYSKFHPHHRGIFLAYTKTTVGDLHPDFWNTHNGTGRIIFDRLDSATAGPVTARFVARHHWEATGAGTVLRERWEVEAYDVPGWPCWVFDLTSTQQAEGKPIELPKYRYGGMAYRGAEPFVKGPLDVLTSSGLDRKRGDQKPARWVDLTGPVADGSDRYGGALVLDHPSNPHHPTPARIHPTTLPFVAFTPSHDRPLTLPADRPTVFRYRFVLHDGRPDDARDERLWRDFAEPPEVSVESDAR